MSIYDLGIDGLGDDVAVAPEATEDDLERGGRVVLVLADYDTLSTFLTLLRLSLS